MSDCPVLRFVENCIGLSGALEIRTGTVTAKQWQDFCAKNPLTFFANGRMFEVVAKDGAAKTVKLSARWS